MTRPGPKPGGTIMHAPTTWLNPKIEVTQSSIHGKGMIASTAIGPGEKIVRWGEGYTDRAGAEEARRQGKGVMQWDENIFSCELSGNDDLYSINHSCDPNTWMSDAFTLVARRPIKTGEEITADIALWKADEESVSQWMCNCCSTICRGRITGRDWRSPELQVRYHGHFSPLINKRISTLSSSVNL